MNKKYSLLFALLLTLLVLNLFFILSSKNNLLSSLAVKERKKVVIERIIDGDTFVTNEKETIRLININTPEKNTPTAKESIDFLKQFENKTVEIDETKKDKYKRTLARVYAPDYINLQIISLGLGNKFLVDESETKIFYKAEKSAIENSFGIWKHSKSYDCVEIKIDFRKEIANLKSKCGKINLKGWLIKDESRKEYKFKDISIEEVNLHSLNGTDNETDIYWNNKEDIWNNDRDTAYLFDSEWSIVKDEPYGY